MAEAKLNREYAVRILGVGAMMVGMCVWSLYDGLVAWPRHNQNLEQIRPELMSTNLTAEAWVERGESGYSPLTEAFSEKGMKTPSKLIKKLGELKVPNSAPDRVAAYTVQIQQIHKLFEKPVYSQHDLKTQFVQAVLTCALGLLSLGSLGLKARKRFCADETGLFGSGFGLHRFTYADIALIDWTNWDEKGIMTLTFKSGERQKLDGWHFIGVSSVVAEIQKNRPDLCPKPSLVDNT